MKQFSEEAQLTGKMFGDRLDWIAGFFHIAEDPFADNLVRTNAATKTAPITHTYNYRTSDAAFAQLGLKLTNTLKLNAGFRQTWERSRVCSGSSATPAADPAAVPETPPKACASLTNSATVRYKASEPTYTVGLDWQARTGLFVYGVHRRGFRAGGVNSPAFVTARTAPLRPYQSYAAERLTDVEVGVKSDFRLAAVPVRLNLSAYRSTFSNVQTSFNVSNIVGAPAPADAPLFNALVINTGRRRFVGVEGELVVRPTPRLTIGANAAYIHQKVLENGVPTNLPGLIAPAIVKLSPTWSHSATARWELPLRAAGGRLYLNADYYRQTRFAVGNATLSGYDVTNARLEWANIGGSQIGSALFVRNIFDKRYFDAAGATAASLGFFSGHIAEPRVYGAEASVRF